jgi:hypothetical protein
MRSSEVAMVAVTSREVQSHLKENHCHNGDNAERLDPGRYAGMFSFLSHILPLI